MTNGTHLYEKLLVESPLPILNWRPRETSSKTSDQARMPGSFPRDFYFAWKQRATKDDGDLMRRRHCLVSSA